MGFLCLFNCLHEKGVKTPTKQEGVQSGAGGEEQAELSPTAMVAEDGSMLSAQAREAKKKKTNEMGTVFDDLNEVLDFSQPYSLDSSSFPSVATARQLDPEVCAKFSFCRLSENRAQGSDAVRHDQDLSVGRDAGLSAQGHRGPERVRLVHQVR